MPKPKKYTARNGTVTWRVRFRDPDGRDSSLTFTNERAAAVFCADITNHGIAAALDMQDTGHGNDNDTPTVDELSKEFFAWKEARVRSDRTVADYRRDYKRWIKPTFGHLPADRVTVHDVQGWVDAMHAGTLIRRADGSPRPASPKSIADRHAILHGIYAWAAAPARAHVADNPTAGTDLPPRSRSTPKGIRPAEWQALHSCLRQINPDAADLAAFLLGSGWRWSEATALTTYGVEDDGVTMHVTMSQVARRNAAGRTVIVQDAKSNAGFRRVRLDQATAQIVRRRLETAVPGGLVFTTTSGSAWRYGNFVTRYWRPARDAARITAPATPHWLRHTHVALMVTAGARLPELQARIGHSSITTTIGVYGRMVTDVGGDALDAFEALRDSSPAAQARPALPEG